MVDSDSKKVHEHEWKRTGEFWACNPPMWVNSCECGAIAQIADDGTIRRIWEPVTK